MNLLVCDDYDQYNEGKLSSYLTRIIDPLLAEYRELSVSHVSTITNEDLELTVNKELLDYFKCSKNKPEIVLFKPFDEKEVRLSEVFSLETIKDINGEIIENFLSIYTTPIVLNWNYDTLQLVVQKHLPTVLYIYKDEQSMDGFYIFHSEAKKRRRSMLFLKDKFPSEYSASIAELMNIKQQDLPAIVAMILTEDQFLKYKFEGVLKSLTEDAFTTFLDKFVNKQLNKFLISEEANFTNPYFSESGGSVYKYVRKTLDEEVLASPECVVIYPFIEKVISPIFEKLHKTSQKINSILKDPDQSDKIKVGIINMSKNEVPEIKDPLFIHIFKSKSNSPIKLEGNISVKKIINFLMDNNCIVLTGKIEFSPEDEEEYQMENVFESYEDPDNYIYNEFEIDDQIKMINHISKEKVEEIENIPDLEELTFKDNTHHHREEAEIKADL